MVPLTAEVGKQSGRYFRSADRSNDSLGVVLGFLRCATKLSEVPCCQKLAKSAPQAEGRFRLLVPRNGDMYLLLSLAVCETVVLIGSSRR